tara:strand:+ start:270 stop:518 length:249 start_codon:yes stop_codon:yes gene_type:complete
MIKIFSTKWCPSCVSSKRLLDEKQIEYSEIDLDEKNINREQLFELTGGYTVPQIVINDKSIGGYENLLDLIQNNKLQELLNV